jgi:hypothetical protein
MAIILFLLRSKQYLAMKNIFFFTCFIFISLYTLAQNQERVEFPLDDALQGYHSYPIGKEGVVVVYRSKKNGPTNLVKLDTDFKQTKKVNITPPKGYSFSMMTEDSSNLYFLYTPNVEFKKYTVYKIAKSNLAYTSYDGTYVKHMEAFNFQVMGGVVYLGTVAGTSKTTVAFVTCISLPLCYIPLLFYKPQYFPYIAAIDMNKRVAVKKDLAIAPVKRGRVEIIDMTVDESLKVVDLLFNTTVKGLAKASVRQIKDMKMEKEVPFKLSNAKEIQSAEIFSLSENQKVIIGMFKNKSTSKKARGGSARPSPGGIFIGSLVNGKQIYANMVPFTTFKNFKISLITPKKNKSVSDRKQRRMDKMDERFQGTIEFSFHNLLVREDELLVFAEPYYPTYHYETTTTTTANGGTTTTTRRVFDGYRFMGAMVMAFDLEGNFKWENGFKFEYGPLSFSTANKFDFYELEDGGIKVLYNANNSIFSKVIYNDKVDLEKEIVKIKVEAGDKKVKAIDTKYEDTRGLDYWYDAYYIAYGEQKIKSKEKNANNKKRRNVFYLNRIEVEK